jgi:uncharacterized membrane protein YfcA
MSTTTVLILLVIGLVAGFLSGLVGIGGGIVVVPMLVFLLGFSQHNAQGTTLFLFLIPVGILGVYNYYKSGFVDYKTGLVMASTFIVGSYLGSKLAISLDQQMIKRIFGVIILFISLRLILGK